MGPFYLSWINLNPSKDKQLHIYDPYKVWGKITYPSNGAAIEIWECM